MSFASAGSRKSKRLGYKITVSQETEFPMLVRGFDSEKTKDSELTKKRSLKDTFFRQNSVDEERADAMSAKCDSIPIQIDSLDEDDIEESLNFRSPSLFVNEELGSFMSFDKTLNENFPKLYNMQVLSRVLSGEESYETLLYLAINDGSSGAPEAKSSVFQKFGFSNKKKETLMMDSAVNSINETEKTLGDYQIRNLELKKQLESLQSEVKKKKNDYNMLKSSINTILSNINEEKVSLHIKTKSLDLQISDFKKKRVEYMNQGRENVKNYGKKLDKLRESEEMWNMNINDLRVDLVGIIDKKNMVMNKVERNKNLLQELKMLENLKLFQREQIELSLEMLLKTMDFFAESKDHSQFNVCFM